MLNPNDVITIAKAEVGYLEKASADLKYLYDKTANKGKNNYTKYAHDIDTKYPNFYNGKKDGYYWCDVFVDWCFIQAYGVDNAMKMLCQPRKSCGAGCTSSSKYYRLASRFFTTPKIGDQIFFKNSTGAVCHTGIVYNVDTSKVYTIEGNTSATTKNEKNIVIANGDGVALKEYPLNYKYIYGYGRPRYDEVESVTTITNSTINAGGVCMIELHEQKKGSKGNEVKTIQRLLNAKNGANLYVDGDFGTNTYNAVVAYQKVNGLYVDGIVGTNTWNSLLK